MRSISICSIVLGFASLAFAKDPKPYQSGELSQMESVPCASEQTDSQRPICREYVLQSDDVVYHIRPRSPRHAALLPVGERTLFRLQKDMIVLRSEKAGSKEQQYVVTAIGPRSSSSTSEATPVRLNHLQ